MEVRVKPLLAQLKVLEEEFIICTKNTARLEGLQKKSEDDVEGITIELELATKSVAKYSDSSRVNGIPQRFLTKYLVVRLRDALENEKVLMAYQTIYTL